MVRFFAEKFRSPESHFEIHKAPAGSLDALDSVKLDLDDSIMEFYASQSKKRRKKNPELRLYLFPSRPNLESSDEQPEGSLIKVQGKKEKLAFVAVKSSGTGKQWTVAVDQECLVLDLIQTVGRPYSPF